MALRHAQRPMRTSIVTFETRQRERFGNLVREVAHHASGDDLVRIEDLTLAVREGALHVQDAHACLVALRAQQRGLAA